MSFDRLQPRRLGLPLLLTGLGLFGTSVSLFVLFVDYFSEGYEGSWDGIVLGSAWLAFVAAAVVGVAGLLAMLFGAGGSR